MDLDTLQSFFGWCAIINSVLLLIWFVVITTSKTWITDLQVRLFHVDRETVVADNFRLFGQFKLLVMVFNLAPWLALVIMRN